jgi:hypothetical protein
MTDFRYSGQAGSNDRIITMLTSLGIGIIYIAILSLLFDPCQSSLNCEGRAFGDFLVDRSIESNTRGAWIYPFTIQNLMWLLFFATLGEIWLRLKQGRLESDQARLQLLPEDDKTMLRAQDLGAIYNQVISGGVANQFFLQRLITRSLLQFQGSRKVDQTNSLLNSSLDLFQHEVDLRYSMVRYLVWLIPTLGFIGTVIGIALALGEAGNVPDIQSEAHLIRPWIQGLTAVLGVAFYTTLLALLLSAILMFLLHIAQAREEMALNRAGQYCLDNLINRLYEK